jgi:hypothetical protein
MHSSAAEEHTASIITITIITMKAAISPEVFICFY